MVVRYPDFKCVSRLPAKQDSPLVVHSNAMQTPQIATKCFEPIARRGAKILEVLGAIEHIEFASENSG